jgi:hypothetical protein
LYKESDVSVFFLLELSLHCSHPEAYMKDSNEIERVDPSKQYECYNKEGIWKLEIML